MREQLQELVTNPKVAATVATGTTTSGIAQWFGAINSNDATILATLCGAILSIVLIITHIHRAVMEHRKMSFDLDVARMKEEERRRIVEERLRRGEPVRRRTDGH